jgi:hypothetical protein
MRIKSFGYKTININGLSVYAINVRINSSVIILDQVLNDEFWKTRHTTSMRNSISKINFNLVTLDVHEVSNAIVSLNKLLFAHKVQKLVNESSFVINKETILYNTLASIIDINGGKL